MKSSISQQRSSNKCHLSTRNQINNEAKNQSRYQTKNIQRSVPSPPPRPQLISALQATNNTSNDTSFGIFQHSTNNNQASSGNTDDNVDLEDDSDYFRSVLK
ncbi:unnamed protein product [Cunninghamella echinulata]